MALSLVTAINFLKVDISVFHVMNMKLFLTVKVTLTLTRKLLYMTVGLGWKLYTRPIIYLRHCNNAILK